MFGTDLRGLCTPVAKWTPPPFIFRPPPAQDRSPAAARPDIARGGIGIGSDGGTSLSDWQDQWHGRRTNNQQKAEHTGGCVRLTCDGPAIRESGYFQRKLIPTVTT
jgi:hypothetical protein